MPAQITFSIRDEEFQQAMKQYINVSSKDGAFAMNRTMNNFAIFGLEEAKVAQAGEIENVQSLEWWPKYVAAAMVKRKAKQLSVKMEKASAKGKTLSGKAYRRLEMLHYTREEAQKESARIIRKRSVAIGFVRFFFASLSRRMREETPGVRVPPSKSFKGFEVTAKPATLQDPSVEATVKYTYRRRGERSVQKAESLLQDIINRARPRLIEDMRVYIADKLKERSRGVSAR